MRLSMIFVAGLLMSSMNLVMGDEQNQDKDPWEALYDVSGGKISRAEVILYSRADTPFQVGFSEDEVRIKFEDPKTLEALAKFVSMPSRYGMPAKWRGAGGSWYTLGKLVMTTEQGEVSVGITTAGFTCDGKNAHFHNVFSSWGLTKLIDDEFFRETGRHLPRSIFEGWSGEGRIRSHKQLYSELRDAETILDKPPSER